MNIGFFKYHWAGVAIAILIAIVVGAPAVYFQFSDDYQGVPMLKQNTEPHYLAQVQEIYDGFTELGNPFLADLKDEPYLFPPVSPHIVSGFGKVFALSVVEAVMVFRFIAIWLLAFFIYLFTTKLSGRRLVGLAAAPFVILGYAFVNPRHVFSIIGLGPEVGEGGFIDYGRPINPQISSIFFFSYLYFFWRYVQEKGKAVFGVIAAIILGASFYVYLYTWTYIFALNGILFLVYAWKREWVEVKKIFLVSCAAAVIGSAYVAHVLQVRAHPWYAESAPRFGFVETRHIEISRIMLVGLVVFLFIRKWFSKPAGKFFVAFFLTGILIVNEQVITNLYLFNHHYHWYYTTPLFIIFALIVFYTGLAKLKNARRVQKAATFILLVLFFYNGISTQVKAYTSYLPEARYEQRYAPLFEWINNDLERATPLFTTDKLSAFVPALTHADAYYTSSAVYTLAPNQRLLHAYLSYRYLEGVQIEEAREYFEADRDRITNLVFAYQYRFRPGVCLGCFPDTVIEELTQQYQSINDANFISFLQTYPARYLVWDTKENPEWLIEDRFGLIPLKIFEDIRVYELDSNEGGGNY